MAGKGGGAWKVAYADFVTAMMAFFMVMWITAQNQDVRKAVANHFNSPMGRYEIGGAFRPPRHQSQFEQSRPPIAADASAEAQQNSRLPFRLRLNQGDRSLVGTVILFPADSADLDGAAQQELTRFIPLLLGKPQKIEIRGHAARQPPSPTSQTDTWQLSYARCLKTLEYLKQHGIRPERMRLSQAGPHESQGADTEGRVEVFLLSEIVRDERGLSEPASAEAAAPEKADHATAASPAVPEKPGHTAAEAH